MTNMISHQFFSHNSLNARKQKKILPTSYLQGQSAVSMRLPMLQHPLENKVTSLWELCPERNFLQSHLQNPDFFGSRVTVSQETSLVEVLAPMSLLYKVATCKNSTIKGLLYAARAVPSKDYFMHLTLKNTKKGCWVISPDYHASHPRHFCAVGDVIAQRYDVLWDWLWDACHMAGVCWGSCCKGFHSKEGPHYCFEQSLRNPTINLIHEFGNPLGIPYPSCTA